MVQIADTSEGLLDHCPLSLQYVKRYNFSKRRDESNGRMFITLDTSLSIVWAFLNDKSTGHNYCSNCSRISIAYAPPIASKEGTNYGKPP